jgi:predicted O-methyltransferase YrrM
VSRAVATLRRDLGVWRQRATECRHPLVLGSALLRCAQRRRLLAFATGRPASETGAYVREVEDDTAFLAEVRGVLGRWTTYTPRAVDFVLPRRWGSVFFNEVTLYALVRAIRPDTVVETGGTPGKSTAFILRALDTNRRGHLYTIDLPPPATARSAVDRGAWHEQRPEGLGSCWAVPNRLRDRHTLLLGPSGGLLPGLLERLGRLDVFFHDSDHSYANMRAEYEAAAARLGPGGVLVSDDVLANRAFFDFCAVRRLGHARVHNLAVARVTRTEAPPGPGG